MINKTVNIFPLRAAALASVLALCAAAPASAASLSFNSTPVSDAVAQIDSKFGVTISLKQGIDPNMRVTFSVDNLQGRGARLDAINQLANALNADFQKVIVVRKASADGLTPSSTLDSDTPVNFQAGSMPTRDAIEAVVGVDGAVARITGNVDGSVKFTGDETTVKEAADEIARQSHTVWKTFYAIAPRNRGGAVAAGGKIIGYTGAGKPIVELPLRTFRVAPDPPVVDQTNPDGTAVDPNQPNDGTTPAQQAQGPQNPYNPFGYYGSNYNPYAQSGMGYSGGGYGNNIYGGGVYGTNGGGYSTNGLTVLPGWPGYGFGAPTVINNGPYGYPYR